MCSLQQVRLTTVTVDASQMPAIDTQTANDRRDNNRQQVQHMPVYERDPTSLIRLTPGVLADGAQQAGGGGFQAPGTQTGASSGGGGNLGHSSSVFATENGASANATAASLKTTGTPSTGSAPKVPSGAVRPSSLPARIHRQHQMVTNAYDAENGRFSGAVTQITSKSGTNNLHGSFFFQIMRPGLNAYQRWNGPGSVQAYNPTTGAKLTPAQRGLLRDEDRYNQWGGSLGGPSGRTRFRLLRLRRAKPDYPADQRRLVYHLGAYRTGAQRQHCLHLSQFPGIHRRRHRDRFRELRNGWTHRRRKLQNDRRTGNQHRLSPHHPSRQQDLTYVSTSHPGVGSGLSNTADIAQYTII